MDLRTDSSDYRVELLSPNPDGQTLGTSDEPSWRLNFDGFQLPKRPKDPHFILRTFGRKGKVARYYKRQEKLLEGFGEMETITELGGFPGALTEDDKKNLAKSETTAIRVSNAANLVLFVAKVYASMESRSLAVIASTLDSLLDLLSGFILWFTSYAMQKPNQYRYPVGKKRMQPVGIIVFASIMATLGFQILLESVREIISTTRPSMDPVKEKWTIGIMVSVTIIKFALMIYCRRFENEIVRAYALDHFFDVITNSTGLAMTVLAIRYYWWMDPSGAILIALYTMGTWARTIVENVWSLIGRSAPPDYLTKMTYLIWNHHERIEHITTVRAYAFGLQYFVEVDIVLPGDMPLSEAHNIGETLQEKIEQLPEVERAFVHVDFESSHNPEHKQKA
ncbi:metal tolerance protein 10-like [Magnolia sinica]|uniref:metal tolerance protein 10-like n=1 Tax=Magnolia sinica TaxID=86752 RepID=UPI0026593B0E|nr:metal tolerance protein 10-like [Magnolia sinica]